MLFSFLATGDSFWTLSTRFHRGESRVTQVVYDVSEAIWEVMSPIYMAPPTENDWRQIEHRFSTRWNFPNCIGALDGKHIMMRTSPNSSSMFYNYKGYFSIILMALVDADNRFVFVDIGQYGSNGDSGVFKGSWFGQNYMNGTLNLPGPKQLPNYPRGGALPHCIVADEAFPLHMDLLRPFPKGKNVQRLPYHQTIFNYRLSRARCIVENAFGILVQRFRIFDRRLTMDDHNVIKLVKATTVLHNYLCTANMDVANVMAGLNPQGTPYLQRNGMLRGLDNQGYHSKTAAQHVHNIYTDYFNSQQGAVPWQGNQIHH